MIELKPQECKHLMGKYDKLMHKIAHGIFGDITSQHEDSYQDLCVSAIEAVNGFAKKTGNSNYEDFKDDDLFNKYIKTVLWNKLNSKRRTITQSLDSNRLAVRIHTTNQEEDDIDVEDTSTNEVIFQESEEYLEAFPEEERVVIDIISNDPLAFLKNGKVNIDRIRRKANFSTNKVNRLIDTISSKIRNDL